MRIDWNEIYFDVKLMLEKTYSFNGRDAFTLFLHLDFYRGHSLFSSFPNVYFRNIYWRIIYNTHCAYVPTREIGIRILDEAANKIQQVDLNKELLYPDYLMKNGKLFSGVEHAIKRTMQVLQTYPKTHYCRFNNTIEFFVLNGMYVEKRNAILRSANEITIEEFEYFLLNEQMKNDYCKLVTTGLAAYEIIEDGDLTFVLLLKEKELLMAIAI